MIGKNKTVYLTSYMRPELTRASIESVLRWTSLTKLVVIIDGLRKGANASEILWRNKTIEVVETFGASHPGIDLWVYDENVGITEHAMRIQGRAISTGSSGIWLEEDIALDLPTYSIIVDQVFESRTSNPLLMSAYSHFNHPILDDKLIKDNLFLPLWGIVFNESFYDLISSVWRRRNFDPNVVRDAISPIFSEKTFVDRLYKSKVIGFWTEYSSWGFANANRWDALANYALWTEGFYSLTTLTRLAHDLSYKDSRAMNPRAKPEKVQTHDLRLVPHGQHFFCGDCEEWGSRFSRSIGERFKASIKFRLNR